MPTELPTTEEEGRRKQAEAAIRNMGTMEAIEGGEGPGIDITVRDRSGRIIGGRGRAVEEEREYQDALKSGLVTSREEWNRLQEQKKLQREYERGVGRAPIRGAGSYVRERARRGEQRISGERLEREARSRGLLTDRETAEAKGHRQEQQRVLRARTRIAAGGAWREAGKMEQGISLPIGIMLIIFAVLLDILDLFDAIPSIGTIITIMMSAGGIVLWILYWLAGARGLAKAIVMLLAYIAEMIPVIGLFPINTIVAVAVYLISQPWFRSAVIGAVGIAGAAGRLGRKVVGAFGGLAGGKKPAEEYA